LTSRLSRKTWRKSVFRRAASRIGGAPKPRDRGYTASLWSVIRPSQENRSNCL